MSELNRREALGAMAAATVTAGMNPAARPAERRPDLVKGENEKGQPLRLHHCIRKAKDGTLTPWVPLGIAAGKDGTVYALTLAPFTLLQFKPESLR